MLSRIAVILITHVVQTLTVLRQVHIVRILCITIVCVVVILLQRVEHAKVVRLLIVMLPNVLVAAQVILLLGEYAILVMLTATVLLRVCVMIPTPLLEQIAAQVLRILNVMQILLVLHYIRMPLSIVHRQSAVLLQIA